MPERTNANEAEGGAPGQPGPVGGDARSDGELVEAVNRGDRGAFDALYRRHRGFVFKVAARLTRDEADALDVVQETFVYLAGKFPGFVLTAKLTTFLYPVVRHNAMAVARKRRAMRIGGELPTEPAAPPGPPARVDEGLAGLAGVLSCLPEPQREVVLMRFVDGMAMEEIGVALGIPTGTVKSRLHHALATLRADPLTRRYFLGDEVAAG